MSGKPWLVAVRAFERHLSESDWSGQTPSRQAILKAFLRLATERGFNSVSMRMIAVEIGIKAPSLYAHFPEGRDEIVAESLRWHFNKFGSALLEELHGVDDPAEGIRRMVRVHVSRQLTLPESNLWDLLVATDAVVHFLPASLRQEIDSWVDLYEALFRSAAGELGHKSPEQPVKVVMTILEGSNRWAMWNGKKSSIRACVDRATELTVQLLAGK